MSFVTLWDLIYPNDYRVAVNDGLIRTQKHPELDLWIHNYTATAQFTKGAWDNQAVRLCRGIITNQDDEILAQPFAKFFNYGQPEAGYLNPEAPAKVLDKLDGSLGILYPTGNLAYTSGLRMPEYAIATRGSFSSEQAIHATKIWNEKYAPFWTPDQRYTYLFEIIYPDNRIVVDYGDMNDLVFLGCNQIGSKQFSFIPGGKAPSAEWWPGPMVQLFPEKSLTAALSKPPRKNAEGLVVVLPHKMVKIKQEDYITLHRLVTGLRPRAIWEFLAVNACKHLIEKPKHWGSKLRLDPERAKEILEIGPDWKSSYLENVPDEFYAWVNETIEQISTSVDLLEAQVTQVAESIWHLPRREYFNEIKKHRYFGILGLMYDGRDITTELWKEVYPSAEGKPFREQGEDIA